MMYDLLFMVHVLIIFLYLHFPFDFILFEIYFLGFQDSEDEKEGFSKEADVKCRVSGTGHEL